MSKLEKLIKELCPDGVKRFLIDEICNISRGVVISKDYIKDNLGQYPVYSSQTENEGCLGYINTYNFDGEFLTWTTDGANAGTVFYRNGRFSVTNVCGLLSVKYPGVLIKYIYYVLCIEAPKFVNAGMGNPKLMSNVMARITIPVPPIPVQEEIVRILDSFTELTAELTARKKQYEYYRDKLLAPYQNIPMIELGSVCEFVRGPFGGALKKAIFQPKGYAVYEQQHAIYRSLDFRYYIDEAKFIELKRFAVNSGDMIVSCSGTIGKTFVIPDNAPKGIINQALLKITPREGLNVFYLQYFFESTISKILNEVSRGGAIKNVPSVGELKAIKIPLPPLDVQKHLIQVLDNFDSICSNLKIGLPAEIEARQKQYEYYRNKLLSFNF